MPAQPRFSVVCPVHNRPELVRAAIDSVLAQTFSDYELIVVDDGSTDATPEVVRSYGGRVTLLQQPKSGAEAARYLGVTHARGEYLIGLDSDDLFYPEAFAVYDRALRAFDDPPVLLAAMSYFEHGQAVPVNPPSDGSIECLRYKDFLSKDQTFGVCYTQLVLQRSTALAMAAVPSTATAFPFDIADVLLRVGTCSPFIKICRPYTVAYRVHATNSIQDLNGLLRKAPCLARYERQGQYPGGSARRFERRSYIGTLCASYALQGLRRKRFGLSAKLVLATAPMVLAGVLKLIKRRFRRRVMPVRLPA
jgi:glycosyltransferase involved in cell wall biosynthesis